MFQNTLQRMKRQSSDEEVRQKLEKLRSELNAEVKYIYNFIIRDRII